MEAISDHFVNSGNEMVRNGFGNVLYKGHNRLLLLLTTFFVLRQFHSLLGGMSPSNLGTKPVSMVNNERSFLIFGFVKYSLVSSTGLKLTRPMAFDKWYSGDFSM